MSGSNKIRIKDLSENDRPREKFLNLGKQALSNAELIAILLGSGNKEETAIQLAQRILKDVDNKLHNLSQLSIKQLMSYKGVGEAKAITISAALELGKRREEETILQKPDITSSIDCFNLMKHHFREIKNEQVWALYLNSKHQLISKFLISNGGFSIAKVSITEIFRKAFELNSRSFIICHNHPSGNCYPSTHDIEITKNILNVSKYLEIAFLDHLIITDNDYYSFADKYNGIENVK